MFPWVAALLAVGFYLCSRITALWEFYLYYGIIVGTGFTAIGFIPHVSLMARWFERRRGLATSLALAGTGVGSFLFAPLSGELIARYGWRTSYLIYAVLIAGVLIPLTLLFQRSHPADLGLHPDGEEHRVRGRDSHTAAVQALVDATPYRTAVATPAFWALSGIVFTIACNTMLLTVHQNQYLVDSGFSPAFAAWMLGFNGLFRSGGSILWGYISDRATRETSFTISTLLGVLALLIFLSVQTAPQAWRVVAAVAVMGLGYGGVSVIYSTAAADLFQGRHFGKILGLMEIGFGLGASFGSYVAGFVFDRWHTYQPSFYLTIVLMLASIACIWVAAPRAARSPQGRPPSRPVSTPDTPHCS
jgi:MFS family permease